MNEAGYFLHPGLSPFMVWQSYKTLLRQGGGKPFRKKARNYKSFVEKEDKSFDKTQLEERRKVMKRVLFPVLVLVFLLAQGAAVSPQPVGAEATAQATYKVVWPLSHWGGSVISPAPRPASLDNKTIAWVGGSYRGDEMSGILEELLRQKYTGLKFLPMSQFSSVPVDKLGDALKAAGADLMVSGNGC